MSNITSNQLVANFKCGDLVNVGHSPNIFVVVGVEYVPDKQYTDTTCVGPHPTRSTYTVPEHYVYSANPIIDKNGNPVPSNKSKTFRELLEHELKLCHGTLSKKERRVEKQLEQLESYLAKVREVRELVELYQKQPW